MNLNELNKKLHGRDVHLDRDRKPDPFAPEIATPEEEVVAEQFKKTEAWGDTPEKTTVPHPAISFGYMDAKTRRKKIALILGSLALVLLLGGVIFKVVGMMFSEEKITVSLSGPREVASAEQTSFSLQYANNNRVPLQNVTVVFNFPETFQPEGGVGMKVNSSRAEVSLGSINAMATGKTILSGKFYGSKGDKVKLQATLQYSQQNVSSILTKNVEFEVTIVTSPLSIEISAPQDLASGQDVEYIVEYKNTGDQNFSNLRVKLEYPSGFAYLRGEPRATEGDNLWYVGDLPPKAAGKIIVRGTLDGSRDERKTIVGKIGFFQGDGNFVAYSENERKTRIVASPLTIRQTMNSMVEANASLGESLRYEIDYKNEGDIGVRDAIVILEIDSPFLDYKNLKLTTKGGYDQAKKMIVWKASDVPALTKIEPGQGGKISFTIPIVESLGENSNAKNITIRTLAKIDSPDVPAAIESNKIIGSNILYVKVNTVVTAALDVHYADATIPNSGPLPPKVGEETSYTLHLKVTNTSNDVTNARGAIHFPSGIRYTGKSSPTTEKIIFNERTNELAWDMGTLESGKTRTLIVQIAGTPSPNHAEQEFPLVNDMIFTGKDSFTLKDIKVEVAPKNSGIPEDTSGGRVQKAQ